MVWQTVSLWIRMLFWFPSLCLIRVCNGWTSLELPRFERVPHAQFSRSGIHFHLCEKNLVCCNEAIRFCPKPWTPWPSSSGSTISHATFVQYSISMIAGRPAPNRLFIHVSSFIGVALFLPKFHVLKDTFLLKSRGNAHCPNPFHLEVGPTVLTYSNIECLREHRHVLIHKFFTLGRGW